MRRLLTLTLTLTLTLALTLILTLILTLALALALTLTRYNVFRAAVAANTSTLVMALPAHYNDPGIIERSVPLNEVRARARARVRSLGPGSG